MTRIGIISDVHAQLDALEIALDALTSRGVDRVLCAGDLVDKGPDGDAVVEMVQERLIPCVLGNHDETVARHHELYARVVGEEDALKDETVAFLADLPLTRSYTIEGQRILLAHGIPTSNRVYFWEDRGKPKELKRWARNPGHEYVILGHTHRPMDVDWLGVRYLNPGSVSRVRPRDSHTCAILTLPEGTYEVIDL